MEKSEKLKNPKKNSTFLKVLLILITGFVLAPLIFVGACFPLGLAGFGMSYSGEFFGTILFGAGWIIGIGLALYVLIQIISMVAKKQPLDIIWKKVGLIFLVLIVGLIISGVLIGVLSLIEGLNDFSNDFIDFIIPFIIVLIIGIASFFIIKILRKKID